MVEPISIKDTPNLVSSLDRVEAAAASGLNTNPLIFIPTSSADSTKFFIAVVAAVTR